MFNVTLTWTLMDCLYCDGCGWFAIMLRVIIIVNANSIFGPLFLWMLFSVISSPGAHEMCSVFPMTILKETMTAFWELCTSLLLWSCADLSLESEFMFKIFLFMNQMVAWQSEIAHDSCNLDWHTVQRYYQIMLHLHFLLTEELSFIISLTFSCDCGLICAWDVIPGMFLKPHKIYSCMTYLIHLSLPSCSLQKLVHLQPALTQHYPNMYFPLWNLAFDSSFSKFGTGKADWYSLFKCRGMLKLSHEYSWDFLMMPWTFLCTVLAQTCYTQILTGLDCLWFNTTYPH